MNPLSFYIIAAVCFYKIAFAPSEGGDKKYVKIIVVLIHLIPSVCAAYGADYPVFFANQIAFLVYPEYSYKKHTITLIYITQKLRFFQHTHKKRGPKPR